MGISKSKLSFFMIIAVFTAMLLVSCSVTIPDGDGSASVTEECKHSWGIPEIVKLPLCGTNDKGIKRYTCELCSKTKDEYIFPYVTHVFETVVIRETLCETGGIFMEKCKNCGYSKEYTTDPLTHNYKFSQIADDDGSYAFVCQNCNDVKKYASVITYEDYGAVGDGETDDSAAIRAAHEAANEVGAPVLGREDAIYYIGSLDSTINIRTDTDWNGARFIFDDDQIRWDNARLRGVYVFTVVPDKKPENVAVPTKFSLSKGQTNVGMSFDSPCMIKIENANERIYMRYGENANGGVVVNEMILVDEQGNVDPSTPIQYDYPTVTKITAYSTNEKPITLSNATITTIAPNPRAYDPDYENNYCYYGRGIAVQRSNTVLRDIKHVIDGEDMTIEIDRNGDGVIDKWGADKSYGVPYIGFFNFKNCNNALMTDCILQGHQAYSFYQNGGTTRNEMGSYDLNATDCINLKLVNLVQYENADTGEVITNRFMYHGVMGSNFCRNVVMDNCYLDRFDSHQGLHNARITNSTLGFGILVIGGGELYIENVYRISGGAFIMLRMDYNSVFDGDVIIKDCKMGSAVNTVITGTWRSFYNGLPNYMTNSLVIDGLEVQTDTVYLYNITGAVKNAVNDDENKLYLPETVKVSGVCKSNGLSVSVRPSKNVLDAFSSIEVIFSD